MGNLPPVVDFLFIIAMFSVLIACILVSGSNTPPPAST